MSPDSRAKRKPKGEIEAKPVLPEGAAVFLKFLCTEARVFEFGGGGSTLWLSQFVTSLITIEDDADWVTALLAKLPGCAPVAIRYAPTSEMAAMIDAEHDLDVVFVDCLINKTRRECILRSLNHVKPGGWLVADDYHFPIVKRTIDGLPGSMWSTVIMRGRKMHPLTEKLVTTETAFCHKAVL